MRAIALVVVVSAVAFTLPKLPGSLPSPVSCTVNILGGGGICADSDGSGVTVNETRTEVEYGGESNPGGWNAVESGGSNAVATDDSHCISTEGGRCLSTTRAPSPADPAAPLPVITTVTSSDVADFAPAAAALSMEPNGWGILHRPVNFWVDAAPHQRTGTLFGRPISIDFSPASVAWDYGDGNGWTTQTTGASWAELGLADLSTTATSHVYTQPGPYTVTATVHWRATVHVDGRSIAVTGDLTTTSRSAAFELYESSSVLVPNRP